MILAPISNVITVLLTFGSFAAIFVESNRHDEAAKAVDFMTKFGYLKHKDARLGQLRSQEELENAIKNLQRFAGIPITGEIDAATIKLMHKSRCGISDFGPTDNMRRRRRFALQGTKWQKNHLTYQLLGTGTATKTIHKARINATLRKAFDMWTKVTPMTFTEILEGVADIRIDFRMASHDDGYPFDGRGGTLAHGFYPLDNKGLAGDIHFDDDEHWVLENVPGGTDFFWTAVHEIGHALGLDHSDRQEAIMYPYYQGYKDNLKLQVDDITGIQNIYGKPPPPSTTVAPTKPTMDPSEDICQMSFDAAFHSKDGNTYFFKESQFWKLDRYNIASGPLSLAKHWPHLGRRVQAVYTRLDGKTVFFKGKRFWVYEGTKYIEGPLLISHYGLPLALKRLDGVFVWGGNGKTYFFKDHQYWRYNEAARSLDPGYPKNISEGWGAIPSPIDSVMSWKDGNSYFFHGKTFHKYDFYNRHEYEPQNIGHFFMGCMKLEAATNGVERTAVLTPLLTLFAIAAAFLNV